MILHQRITYFKRKLMISLDNQWLYGLGGRGLMTQSTNCVYLCMIDLHEGCEYVWFWSWWWTDATNQWRGTRGLLLWLSLITSYITLHIISRDARQTITHTNCQHCHNIHVSYRAPSLPDKPYHTQTVNTAIISMCLTGPLHSQTNHTTHKLSTLP